MLPGGMIHPQHWMDKMVFWGKGRIGTWPAFNISTFHSDLKKDKNKKTLETTVIYCIYIYLQYIYIYIIICESLWTNMFTPLKASDNYNDNPLSFPFLGRNGFPTTCWPSPSGRPPAAVATQLWRWSFGGILEGSVFSAPPEKVV